MTAALRIERLEKRFGRTAVLRGVDLELAAGERHALIGPNGAGKSTLFDLVSGRAPPDAGRVRLHGRDVTGLAPQALARLGLTRSFQVAQLFPGLSVRANLRCAVLAATPQRHGLFRRVAAMRAVAARTDALLERLGLAGRADVEAGRLSHAEQRMLEIGLAVAPEPGVLLLDEPTAGLSRSESDAAVALIRGLAEGRALLVVEHDMAVVFGLADRISVLVDGRIVACGPPGQIRADPRVREAYLGGAAAPAGHG